MDKFDLNIENYDLDEILTLFRIDIKLTNESVKKAHRIALKMHPDKSGLSKEYFIFFMKAYEVVSKVYRFQNRRDRKRDGTIYSADVDQENAKYLRSLDGKSVKDFNKWFNEMFDKVKVKDGEDDSGYGKWFRDKSEMAEDRNVPLSQFSQEFERKKQKCRSMVVHRGVEEAGGNGGYNLSREGVESYSSSMFSKLQYEDLKKAHTETVVPVTMEDFHNKTKFDNVDSCMRHRRRQDTQPLSAAQARQYLAEKSNKTNELSARRAYSILKREEEIQRSNQAWWAHLKQLTN